MNIHTPILKIVSIKKLKPERVQFRFCWGWTQSKRIFNYTLSFHVKQIENHSTTCLTTLLNLFSQYVCGCECELLKIVHDRTFYNLINSNFIRCLLTRTHFLKWKSVTKLRCWIENRILVYRQLWARERERESKKRCYITLFSIVLSIHRISGLLKT